MCFITVDAVTDTRIALPCDDWISGLKFALVVGVSEDLVVRGNLGCREIWSTK